MFQNAKFVISALTLTAALSATAIPDARAQDVLNVKAIGTALARDIADKTVAACDAKGYSVAAVVVDRGGNDIAMLRHQFAAAATIVIAGGKARGAMMAGTSTSDLRANRPELAATLNLLEDVKMMDGGLPISAGGMRIGAVGVSGAPGGDIDEACAQEALDEMFDRIEFAQ
ncbi:MAG: heme-binding protein [Rhodospirillales bacterium]|nr:heme-binding protein [Rhodospirillales bacterium]MBO6785426.1 heme-binding protein [Rhodospirillales bacterium]